VSEKSVRRAKEEDDNPEKKQQRKTGRETHQICVEPEDCSSNNNNSNNSTYTYTHSFVPMVGVSEMA
jgi:hypothetical protein